MLKSGSENNPPSSNPVTTDCPNCGAEESLVYSMRDMEIDDMTGETVLVEGLICSECSDIYMSPDEGARFLNIKAKHDRSLYYYGVHDGEITETKLQ